MASFRKIKTGWRAELCVNGRRKSKSFDSKLRARAWADDEEKRLSGWIDPSAESKTLGDAFRRFSEEISPLRKGERWEQVRLKRLCASRIANIPLRDLSPQDLASWRDSRLQEVSAGSVRREMALMAGVFSYCLKEWGWIDRSPLALVRKPPAPKHRDRLITDAEIRGLLQSLPPKVGAIFQLALETAMRLGEICAVNPAMRHSKYLRLPETKNGSVRLVPLSPEARKILDSLDNEISVSPEYISRTFQASCKALGIKDCRFHDTRHTAFTRLSQKLNVLELARMAGMRDTKTIMIYFNESPENIADKLG
jgi:integrase